MVEMRERVVWDSYMDYGDFQRRSNSKRDREKEREEEGRGSEGKGDTKR